MATENETNATAESPVLTDSERQKLEEQAERTKEEIANRPLFHVLVRHMARNPRTRTMRAARSGHRRQGVTLDDGTRIRKKGRQRLTEVSLLDIVNNHERFLEYVRVGSLEVCDPRSERPISYKELVELLGNVKAWAADKQYEVACQQYEQLLEQYEAEHKVWEEAGGEESGLPEPKKPKEPSRKDFMGDITDPDETSDTVPGFNEMNTAPSSSAPPASEGEDPGEEDELEDEDVDQEPEGSEEAQETDGDADEDEDQGEGEEPTKGPDATGEFEWTQAELKKMSRAELDEVAKLHGVNPEDYSNMNDLRAALLGEKE